MEQLRRDNVVAHKFMIGQSVDLMHRVLRFAAAGRYEIRRLMPAADSDPSDPRYRIKNADESYERVALESELTQAAQLTVIP
jgi:hypothetical protein